MIYYHKLSCSYVTQPLREFEILPVHYELSCFELCTFPVRIATEESSHENIQWPNFSHLMNRKKQLKTSSWRAKTNWLDQSSNCSCQNNLNPLKGFKLQRVCLIYFVLRFVKIPTQAKVKVFFFLLSISHHFMTCVFACKINIRNQMVLGSLSLLKWLRTILRKFS